MKSYKLVEWSYPSSPNAEQFGFARQGCYTLHTANAADLDGHKTVSGHATLAEAKIAGGAFPQPWHPAMSEGWRANDSAKPANSRKLTNK